MATADSRKALRKFKFERRVGRTIVNPLVSVLDKIGIRSSSVVELETTGAKSGKSRINPLAYQSDGGRYIVFASKAGAPTNPDWYHNLKAQPNVTIEVGTDTIDVIASEATGAERDRLFDTQVERVPQFADYEKQAVGRVIPVIVLTPTDTD